jgi:hypothetical protein
MAIVLSAIIVSGCPIVNYFSWIPADGIVSWCLRCVFKSTRTVPFANAPTSRPLIRIWLRYICFLHFIRDLVSDFVLNIRVRLDIVRTALTALHGRCRRIFPADLFWRPMQRWMRRLWVFCCPIVRFMGSSFAFSSCYSPALDAGWSLILWLLCRCVPFSSGVERDSNGTVALYPRD